MIWLVGLSQKVLTLQRLLPPFCGIPKPPYIGMGSPAPASALAFCFAKPGFPSTITRGRVMPDPDLTGDCPSFGNKLGSPSRPGLSRASTSMSELNDQTFAWTAGTSPGHDGQGAAIPHKLPPCGTSPDARKASASSSPPRGVRAE